MLDRLLRSLPLFILLMGLTAVAMYGPMLVAGNREDWLTARTFFYYGTFFLILTSLLAIPFLGRPKRRSALHHLGSVFFAFLVLPAMMAMPVNHLVDYLSFFHAYFEMLSSFTTTGASLIDSPSSVADTVHYWRAFAGWLGGLLMLVVAISIFAPLNIGGFEVYSQAAKVDKGVEFIIKADVETRLYRFAYQIFPIYTVLTAILAIVLVTLGEAPLTGVIHAMAILSTSGISAVGGLQGGQGGFVTECVMFLFMFVAVSRFFTLSSIEKRAWTNVKRDREINIAIICVIAIPLLLFLRHWTGAIEVATDQDTGVGFASLWGGVFTVMSFLTTTGFESRSWDMSQAWSGLETPGVIFMALAAMGGGVATTAGGVKLLRVYALLKHGKRELQKLRYPSSLGGSGVKARSLRREGAYISWIFLMLFLVILSVVMLGLSTTGLSFESSLALAVAGLSTTGPLLDMATDSAIAYSDISDTAKAIFCGAMILGRFEVLAVISLLNIDFWRE